MQKILDELWSTIQTGGEVLSGSEQSELLHRTVACEEKLSAALDGEQIELFNEYRRAVDELCATCEREAFIKGVRCAASFLREALFEKE